MRHILLATRRIVQKRYVAKREFVLLAVCVVWAEWYLGVRWPHELEITNLQQNMCYWSKRDGMEIQYHI